MLSRNRKNRKSIGRGSTILLNKDCIHRLQLIGLTALVCTLFGGCGPAGFAASAILINYINEQSKTQNSTTYPSRQQKPMIIARQTEAAHVFVLQTDGRTTVEKASQAYRNLEWNESTRLLKEAIGRGELSRSDQSQAYILLGAMAYQQSQVNEAESYFKKTLKIDRSVTPSAELYPPSLIEFYKSVSRNIRE